ncbi:N-acetylglucosamine-6-phosphate deacetylase [Mucilaginibacter sp. UR6-11]|uniref:N-acetylglucosamine-6-phosphate deacetylase n=1 Tax=Mucilaginibacter sp. UR6-11 TaxID=1435644 RepID=UPI001E45EABB|nr:N-acetylglucosamine-6-phosphate deacetylase [Mucilaginibacter sp. UR6-11]MCC8425400.1 N-acetylglucosamine-6-phosphate deacetylase [Mucilaginibacter sp. UR6-11]
MTALYNLQLISDGVVTTGKAVLLQGEKIIAVIAADAIPNDAKKIDLKGHYLAPGLIDLQIYGAGLPLFFGGDPSAEALAQMEQTLLSQGCTGFFATIATNTDEIVEQGIEAAVAYWNNRLGNFLGLHLEGPYLNSKRCGAHPPALIKKAALAQVKSWVEKANGLIRMITLAPELQDTEVLDYLHQQGIILSAGHSNATYAEGKAFLNKPVKAVTHLYNAMPQMHHRDPGYIPAIFEDKPYTSIVADGIHVDFVMVRLAKRELGDKLFLITDAVTESDKGTYQHKFTGDRYVMPDGTLSGSSLTMLKAVQNCVQHAGIELAEAINMASLYPAQLTGATAKGKIEKGFDADLVIFNEAFGIYGVVFKGITKTT